MITISTIIPTDMNQDELRYVIANLATSINWNLKTTTVKLDNGHEYKIDVADIDDYRAQQVTSFGKFN